MKKIFISIFFTVSLHPAIAQPESGIPDSSDSAGQIREFLAGIWFEDSSSAKIEFIHTRSQLSLNIPGTYSYEFFRTDSFPIDGTTISWPPHGCMVNKLNENQIEIIFTLFGGEPILYKYRR